MYFLFEIYNSEFKFTMKYFHSQNLKVKIKNFINLPENVYLDIYDIPGLDDANTADIYFKWVKENFNKFDIIIHVVDINSALNTEGEIKILELIIGCIKNEKEVNKKEVPLFTLINKCDDMIYNPKTDEYELDDELTEMKEQIITTTQNKYKEHRNIQRNRT